MIKVVIEIGEGMINALSEMNSTFTGHPTIIDQDRLNACDGIEVSLDSVVSFETEEEKTNYQVFLMGVTASVINYFNLLKQQQK